MDGSIAGYSGNITVYQNPIISNVRTNLNADPGGVIVVPPTGSYPSSQTHRYTPSGASNTAWEDEIGTIDATLYNTSFTGGSLVFNGSSSYGDFNNPTNPLVPSGTGDFTISAYCLFSTLSDRRGIFSQYDIAAPFQGRSYFLYTDSGSVFSFSGAGNGFNGVTNSFAFSTTSSFVFLTFKRLGNVFTQYLNAVEKSSQTVSNVTIKQTGNILGALSGPYNTYNQKPLTAFLNGQIKYLSVCNTALTQEEIDLEYAKVLTL